MLDNASTIHQYDEQNLTYLHRLLFHVCNFDIPNASTSVFTNHFKENGLSLVLKVFSLYFKAVESNTTSKPIRSCITFKFTKLGANDVNRL